MNIQQPDPNHPDAPYLRVNDVKGSAVWEVVHGDTVEQYTRGRDAAEALRAHAKNPPKP
jgi:hypothetical protein